MAGNKRNVSMSALGSFYDAVFANAKDQTKKYGREGTSDFVGADISDGIAEGIVDVASTLAMSPKVADQFQSNIVNYYNDKLTGGFGLDLMDIGILSDKKYQSVTSWTTAARDEYGNMIGGDVGIKVAPKLEIKNLNDLISDPKAVADAAADKFFNDWKAAMNARALAGLGNEVQKAANYVQLRSIGVDKDVSATVAHAVVNARIGTENSAPAAAALRDTVLAETMAMYGGALTEDGRSELAAFIKSDVMPATLNNVNSFAAGVGPGYAFNSGGKKPPESFADLFLPQRDSSKGFASSPKNILHEYPQNELFGAGKYGTHVKNALQSAIQTSLGDPRVVANPRLKTNLMQLFSGFDDEAQGKVFLSALGDAAAGGYRDMSKAVEVGIRRLSSEHARTGTVAGAAEAARLNAAAGTVGKMDGEMKLGDWLSYMSYRASSNGLFGSTGILMSMVVFGDEGATKAFIDGAGALNFTNLFKPNVGSIDPTINKTYFMDYLAEADGNFRLFSDTEKTQFSKYFFGYKNAEGKAFDDKRNLGWAQLGWTLGPNAGPMQKLAYKFHTYHPYQFVTGLLTGKTPQRMFLIGTDHMRYLNQPAKWSKGAKWAANLMKKNWYKNIMRLSAKAQAIMAIPGRLVRDFTQKAAKVVFEKVIVKVLIKLGLQAVIQAIGAALSAGVTLILYALYWLLNKISGGFLDRVVKGTIRFTFELIISIVLWIAVVIITAFVVAFSLAGYFGTSGAFLHPPDPGYSPVLSYGYGAGQYGGGVNIEPIINPIDWSQYEPFSDNDCPLQINGQPATVCTQGPTGTWSHAGNRGNYAIDIAGSGIGVYAPENGVASPDNISCLTTCEKLLTDSSGNYDPTKMAECKGYVQQYGQNVLGFQFHGNETGRTYRFWHVFFDDDHLNYGEEILKGTFLGAVIPGATACSTGTHVHFEILGDQHPDAAYSVMCDIPPLVCTNN